MLSSLLSCGVGVGRCATALEEVKALGKCDAENDSDVWNKLISCAFTANNWMEYRWGGQGGCGGPTLFKFCQVWPSRPPSTLALRAPLCVCCVAVDPHLATTPSQSELRAA